MVLSLVESRTGHVGADRCPGALAIHQAQDGGLVRIRIPGGALPASVLAALGEWSLALGNGRMELTGRANLQLRGLVPGAEVDLAAHLIAHGLLPSPEHDRVRNVLASPLSGRDGVGAWDVRPLVGELDRGLCAAPELAELPGRFLFALDDGRGDVAGLGADATLLALPGERAALLLGGLDTGVRLAAGEAVGALLAVAREFLRVRADERVWRVTELPGGPLSLVPALVPPVSPDLAAPRRWPRGPVGRIDQADGRVALGVGVPLGELTPRRCRLLADCAHREVVLTPWRGVVLPDLEPAAAGAAAERLAGAGLLLDPEAPLLAVSACTGRPGCASALADVRADALAWAPVGGGLRVHWSGCARRCGRPVGSVDDAVVDVVADEHGYHVLRDGEPLAAGSDAAGVREAVQGVRRAPVRHAIGGRAAAEPPEVRVPLPAHFGPECAASRTSPYDSPGDAAPSDGPGEAARMVNTEAARR